MSPSRLLQRLFLLAACALLLPNQGVAQGTSHYTVVKKLELGGEGGWDYLTVEPGGKRLFVSRSTHVQVVDLASGTLLGDITNTPGVHGVAVVPELQRGFTSNGRDSSVTIFDLKTLQPIKTVRVSGRNPDAIMYDGASKRIFTMNGATNNLTALDPASGSVLATIDVGGKPEAAAFDGNGRMFVNIEDKEGKIAQIDTKTLKLLATWAIAPCEEPTGLAIDRAHHRLFAVCSNSVMTIVDSQNGKVVTTVPIGSGTDGAAFDPASSLAFSSNGEGTVTVVHEESPTAFRVLETVQTQRGARTIALDPDTHRIYLSTASYGPAPAPTADQPRPRAPILPGSFVVLVLEPRKQ